MNAPSTPTSVAPDTGRTRVQRSGARRRESHLYEAPLPVSLEPYFADTTRLGAHVFWYRLEPGASEGDHRHADDDPTSCTPYAVDELYLVVAGEVVMTVDGERTTLVAGDSVYAPAGCLHGVVNESDAPADLVLVFGEPTS